MHANLHQTKRAEFIAITDADAMQCGIELAQTVGIIPAIETAHAFAVLKYKKFQPNDIVVINLSGRGDKDLNTYINYFNL
jgi:tryptophan synthase beta chain